MKPTDTAVYRPGDSPEDGSTEMDVAIALLKADGFRIVKLKPCGGSHTPGIILNEAMPENYRDYYSECVSRIVEEL